MRRARMRGRSPVVCSDPRQRWRNILESGITVLIISASAGRGGVNPWCFELRGRGHDFGAEAVHDAARLADQLLLPAVRHRWVGFEELVQKARLLVVEFRQLGVVRLPLVVERPHLVAGQAQPEYGG